MKELFRDGDLTRINYYQELLEAAGVATFVQNENVSAAESALQSVFLPALCVVDNEDHAEALRLMKEDFDHAGEGVEEDVKCTECGEISPGNFDSCWSCGAALSRAVVAE